ncbi:ABC transporter-like protein [Ornithinimicrobium sp. INDO-MA30-4]|uniref:ABC transporter-like protein n=1 Tax=Ornithinimicrobium sp. INDO-MA30-4 TaxID=2908651 RepID=UPI001F43366C|nr:ABC transporter-like protein [Ornithinimicrobium sp. INDO-MA30-4]UJH69455.1 ABC transporter-like protein [Ornithinimicrobium sp. INDO-MA30-4]
MGLLTRMGSQGRTVLFSSHILEEVEEIARQVEVMVAGRHAASGDFGAIRRLMTERPTQYSIRSSADRTLASALLALASVQGINLEPRGGISVQVVDFGAFATQLPRLAKEHNVSLLEFAPSDESLSRSLTTWCRHEPDHHAAFG